MITHALQSGIAAVLAPIPTSRKRRTDTMPFKRAVQRYGQTPQAETPYHKTGQLWDERIGNARVQAANWRLMALGTLTWPAALPWRWSGNRCKAGSCPMWSRSIAWARRAPLRPPSAYQPTDPQIAWFLARFIKDVRSRSLDPVLMRGTGCRPMILCRRAARCSLATMPALTIPLPGRARRPCRSR
jgi:hypothetical protein